jgi:pyrroloquinoline quinone biosynthesis protein B
VPQWNCSCANCSQTRAGRLPPRTQSGAALSPDGVRWLLLNCSPDIASQVEAYAPLQPQTLRGTPIAGMLFTDANVDHIGGLATLRQSGPHRFVVRSSSITREIAVAQPAFASFARTPHTWIDVGFDRACESIDNADLVENEILVRAIPVPGTTPGYAGRRTLPGATVAYEIREPGCEWRLVFAPIFGGIDERLFEAIARAEVAFLDGSFYSDDELVTNGLLDKSARQLGHQPVGGTDGTLARLHGLRTRIVFTHLNNSNPMLDPNSQAASSLREGGAETAYDGMEIRL